MSELPIISSHSRHAHEELVLLGVRVDAQHEGPQLYTLLAVGGENERPLVADGRVLFFSHPNLAEKALALDTTFAKLGPLPNDIESFCDVA